MFPYRLESVPALLRPAAHHLFVRPRLRGYLSSVVKGFDWYLTRGEPVPRNRFGVHPWFSKPLPDDTI